MIYRRANGTTFTLAHHTTAEWADIMRERLLTLGCSRAYAGRVAAAYRRAVAK